MELFWAFIKLWHYLLLEVTLNERHYDSLFSCANPIYGKILVHKLHAKMLLTNQIAIFLILDMILNIFISYYLMHQSLWFFAWRCSPRKGSITNLYFCVACLGLPSHAQACLDLPGVPLGSPGGIFR